MLFRREIIEGTITEIGNGVMRGNGTKYSFLKIDGKMHRNVITEDFLDSFIQPGRTVRLGIRKTITGQKVVASVQDGSGETHKLPMREIIADALYLGGSWSFVVFLVTFPTSLLFVYKLQDFVGPFKFALSCSVLFFIYYLWNIQKPRHILEKQRPGSSFSQAYPDFK